MLYLVEFAHWDSQLKIGYGCGANSDNTGSTDTMPYHTGTMKSSKTTYGIGVQYRYIEDLWGGVYDWYDGIYTASTNVYCIKNPANFSDSSNGTAVATNPSTGSIKAYSNPTASGFEYALCPSTVGGTSTTYVCDSIESTGAVWLTGGSSSEATLSRGLFFAFRTNATSAFASIGSRLMVLPSSRIS